MSTNKIRIYELAKQLELQSKEVINLLEKKLNIEGKTPSSSITQQEADKLVDLIKKPAPKQEVKEAKPVEQPPKLPEKEIKKVEQKPLSEVPRRPMGERRPEGGRPEYNRPTGERRPDDRRFPPRPMGERRPEGGRPEYNRPGGERRPFTPRPAGERRPEGGRPEYNRPPGERRPFTPRPAGERRPEGARPEYNRPPGERRPFTPRPAGERRPEGARPDQRPEFRKTEGGVIDKKPPVTRHIISPEEYAKKPGKKDFSAKKKEVKHKDEVLSKEDREEQARLLQQKFKKKTKAAEEVKEKITKIALSGPVTVGELAQKADLSAAELVKSLMMQGILATVNQTVDIDTAQKVLEGFEITVIKEDKQVSYKEKTGIKKEVTDELKLKHRAPVVTIMGHVDHGKTTLLDAIRATKHKIVSTEVGGITQSIGAYSVEVNEKKIVFIDTPGHEAFTAMRARGAQSTDIAILVVAADDGIMPQTIEAINHAKAAKVPIIIAVNKMDKPDANPDKVLQQLTEYELVPEEWGGDTICVKVSALQGTNLDELLDYILLVAEVQELKANPDSAASGIVVEARLDKGKGPVATLLVQNGTLNRGDCIVVGNVGGRVRALISDAGERLESAGPSTPVEILGLSEVPQSGDKFDAVADEREMRTIVTERKEEERTSRLEAIAPLQVRREKILLGKETDITKELNIIIKANTHGSAEAVSASIQQLKSKQIFVNVVHIAVGDISEADVMLASASNAIIIGFSVKEDQNAARVAASEGVDIRKYDIIYQILDDIEKTMLGLLQPETREVEVGTAEVRQVFTIGKTVKIAGCYVTEGKIQRNKTASIIRSGKEIFKGTIDQLKRFKDDAKEVATGYECGISFSKFNDLQEGDIIKVTSTEEVERETLV